MSLHLTLAGVGRVSVDVNDYDELRMSRHAHEEAVLVLLLHGCVRERVGRYEQAAGLLEVGFKPARLEHTDWFSPGGLRALRIRVFSGSDAPTAQVPLPRAWMWRDDAEVVRALLRVAETAVAHRPADAEPALFDAFASLSDDDAPALSKAWVRALLRDLDERKHLPLCIGDLAAERGMSAVQLARAVRASTGASLTTYVRRRRVLWAADRIRRSAEPLGRIGIAAGFYDHAHFCRQFRRELGVSPRTFRRLATR